VSEGNKRIIELTSRTTLFNLFAQAFNYPDRELVESLQKGDFIAALRNAIGQTSLAASLDEEITALEKKYTGPDKQTDTLLLEMERDYTHMFFSSKPRLVYLFESVYNEGKLLQDSTFQIARLYYDAGIKLVDDFKLPPDHIAVEFEFMAYLYFNELAAIRENHGENALFAQNLQKEVMEKHLIAFGSTFARKVAEYARTAFYQSMARISIPFLTNNNRGASL
jgi:TorA maturation chaperone TorD